MSGYPQTGGDRNAAFQRRFDLGHFGSLALGGVS